MTHFPGSPRLIKGGIVVIDPETSGALRIIPLQYNPDTLTRTLQVQGVGEASGDRMEALRLKGPPVETIKLDAELDATDRLESSEPLALQYGLRPQLAALEILVYPESRSLTETNSLAAAGTLEIAPAEAPLSIFVWSKTRIVPVRITELSITEEAFDPQLNPIRAKIGLGMRVLSVNDLTFSHRGAQLFLLHHKENERLAALAPGGAFKNLGIGGIP